MPPSERLAYFVGAQSMVMGGRHGQVQWGDVVEDVEHPPCFSRLSISSTSSFSDIGGISFMCISREGQGMVP